MSQLSCIAPYVAVTRVTAASQSTEQREEPPAPPSRGSQEGRSATAGGPRTALGRQPSNDCVWDATPSP